LTFLDAQAPTNGFRASRDVPAVVSLKTRNVPGL
jgi:hypothetical protein